MMTVWGTGTTLKGKNNINPDGSYTATRWFTVFYLPILPLASYRVRLISKNASIPLGMMLSFEKNYEMTKITLAWKQIAIIYIGYYGTAVATIGSIVLYPNIVYLLVALAIILFFWFFFKGLIKGF